MIATQSSPVARPAARATSAQAQRVSESSARVSEDEQRFSLNGRSVTCLSNTGQPGKRHPLKFILLRKDHSVQLGEIRFRRLPPFRPGLTRSLLRGDRRGYP